jgi:acetoacetyl-CoA synthetase
MIGETAGATDLLYQPDPQSLSETQLYAFMRYCEQQTRLRFVNYATFEAFAVNQFRTFWAAFLDWSNIICEGDCEPVCVGDDCETAVFFPALRLNFAENLLSDDRTDNGLIGCHADGSRDVLTRSELRKRVIRLAVVLQQLGVEPGDRVAAIARNNVEVIIAALASAAIGAVFSSSPHDMGAFTSLSRLRRLEPKVLVANCASKPWDVGNPLPERIRDIVAGLPSLSAIITLDETVAVTVPVHTFAQAVADGPTDFVWQRFAFNHPLFILFSSGTTGAPKCIAHGAGGTLLEHVKEHRLHGDLNTGDRMFFHTSCGWMMWNWQLSALACGAEVLVYDGPLKGPETLWEIVAEQQVTVFGTNPAYLQFTETAGYAPQDLNLSALRSVLSTGSILYPKQFEWIVGQVKRIPVQSISGGTDILGCFVLGNPLLPVYRGQAQCRSLGLDVRSLPAGEIGELICANPFPSRPTGFYGETTNERYHDAYFAQNHGVWTHGDLIEFTPHGAIMHGRSDGVLNIRGVRIGPAEIYRILQQIPAIVEAMTVEQADQNVAGGALLILLVVLRAGVTLDVVLISRIRTILVEQGNAMMVPAAIVQVSELPVTHSGKRSEAAARDAVNGRPIRNRSALLNPDCLDGLSGKVAHHAPADRGAILGGDLEHGLCEICQRCMNIPVVQPADNFLALGGDSLAILGFLMEVSARTQTSLPLRALIGMSTVKELAHLLRTGGWSAKVDHSAPQIRAAERRDEEQICHLLDEGFGRGIPWKRIFDHPWQPEAIPRGFVLTVADEIVGFIGLICAPRDLNGKSGLVCNLSSWYVRPAYRGWSNALMAAATQFDVTFTSLTPGKASRRILEAMGFSVLDGAKLFLPPAMHAKTLREPRPSLIFNPIMMRQMLSGAQQRILDDHAHYDCLPMLLVEGDESAFIMIRYRRKYRRLLPYSEVIYCSTPSLLNRHLERVKLAVMRRQGTIGLVVGSQSLPSSTGLRFHGQALFRSTAFAAHELDKLYSELILFHL